MPAKSANFNILAMSTKRTLKPWSEAAARLIRAVSVASLEELRSPIEKELGLNNEEILPDLFDHVNDLKLLAMLGYPGAIRSLVSVASDISTFLATLPPHAEECTADASNYVLAHDNSPKTKNDLPKKDQWPEINQAAAHLHNLVTEHFDSCKVDFHKWQTELPETPFSFPLDILRGRSEAPVPPLKLVSDFCDGLIQMRFNSEIREFMLQQITNAWSWPVVVTAEQYKANRTFKECVPNLRLGETLPINIFSGVIRGPKQLATEVFKILDKERLAPRSEQHLNEFRCDEKDDVPEPLENLIRKAANDEARPLFYVGAMPPRWGIHNIWVRKAALLPELTRDSHAIKRWTEAAFAYAASVCTGNFESYKWAECIENGMRNAGSIEAGLKRTLSSGFKSIAIGDAKNCPPG